ncbi:MAG: ATP-binding protein [Geobacteraceae bacterium]|nr:ATP-binding protein [Geobacteraceae bacterium]
MDKQKLKELITLHKDRFLSRSGLFPRDMQETVRPYLGQREILVITGVRRSGKSSLMRLICGDLMEHHAVERPNILYLNFEDERFSGFTSADFDPLYEAYLELEAPKGKVWLFLDEIQNIPLWEKWLNRLYEFEEAKIFVTGSNASLLGSEIATALTGRNRSIVVWPLSFAEFVRTRGVSAVPADLYHRHTRLELKRLLNEYLNTGGFPEIIKTGDPTILEHYYQDILYRDVITRSGIRSTREIKELALFLASNCACIHSYKSLQGVIGVKSQNTVKSYLQSLADVYLFLLVDLFDYSLKRQIYNPSKVYGVDTAMMQAVSFTTSRNLGRVYENIVFLELKRRNREVYYWKSTEGKEVDFLVREGLAITEAIQVSLDLSDPTTREREVKGLLAAAGAFPSARLTIISEDEEGEMNLNGAAIGIISLWKWLLNKGN